MSQNILFVCSANKQRSKTAEDYFSTVYPELNFKSCGTNIKLCEKEGTNPVTEELLTWADIIFVMEHSHSKAVKQYTSSKHGSKLIVLAIPDVYKYYQKELIDIL
ncbi:phosphotyrosine protein phosphatase [Flavobacterium zepuense]|uniref:Phosphotyrosine protein phosphatase n=1 Tax=Flavobacterium zepuense TaxID=2593302 RepID=A0A552UYT7_9FLAO|nr:phosphotyrosine protein phosphatase [Flavobacterium zepuense]TRW23330.1 phosphotyrosine protein phosphatase [Flavobacterium zepuense]